MMLKSAVLSLAFVLGCAAAHAQTPEARLLVPDEVQWTEIVPGLTFGLVHGEWSDEAHGKYVQMNAGFESPMHTHSRAYHGVVVQGLVTNPYQGEAEPAHMHPGSYFYVPAGAPHLTACVSEEPCMFYTYSDGAWDLEVVE